MWFHDKLCWLIRGRNIVQLYIWAVGTRVKSSTNMAIKQYFPKYSIFALCWLFSLIAACRITFGNKPFIDHKCTSYVSSGPTVYHRIGLPQCEWHCLKMKQCRYLNYNGSSGQCELGFGQCVYLLPALGVSVNVYGPARNACLHWGSGQQTGLISVIGGGAYIARLVIEQALVLGRFRANKGMIYGNDQGRWVNVAYDETLGHELLMADPACTLSWVQYTPHTEIPSGAVIGGHLAAGSPTFVAQAHYTRDGNNYVVPGYYDPNTELAYFLAWGPQTSTDMMILILLWYFDLTLREFILTWHPRNYAQSRRSILHINIILASCAIINGWKWLVQTVNLFIVILLWTLINCQVNLLKS